MPIGYYDSLQVWNVCYKKLIEVELSNGKIINHKILKVDNNGVKIEGTYKDELLKLLKRKRK